MTLRRWLPPTPPQSMVEKIYVSEKLDLSALRTLSLIELHAVGFPMGTAKKFHLACHNGDVHPLSHAVMSPSPSMATLKGGGDEKCVTSPRTAPPSLPCGHDGRRA